MRIGGRQKGTPNKRSLDAEAMAEEMGINPLKFLLMVVKGDLRDFGYVFAQDEDDTEVMGVEEMADQFEMDKKVNAIKPKFLIPLDVRIQAAKEAMPYIYAKRKSVELSADEDTKKIFAFVSQDEFNKPKDAA